MGSRLYQKGRRFSTVLKQRLSEQRYRVIYADTDALGMVYHARYLEMAERARNYALEAAGIQVSGLGEKNNLTLIVYRAAIEFILPLGVDDEVTLRTGIRQHRSSRVWWRTEVALNDVRHALVEVTTVCFDLEARRPVVLPRFLEEALGRVPVFQ
jgi:acyl-CoA thioester hydrolase